MLRTTAYLFLLCLLLVACQPYSAQELVGKWKPTVIVDNGDTINADLRHVLLDLSTDQRFNYQITRTEGLNGSYLLDRQLLYLYTTPEASDTILVEVIDLDEESLVLRMNHGGAERHMHLNRQ